MIRFELMRAQHIDEILEIEKKCFPDDPWTRNMFESELGNKMSVFVCGIDEDSEKVAAYGGMWLIADLSEITNIAVDPAFQREGIGGRLLSLLINICRERKAAAVHLEVRDGNIPAVSMYEKFGFKRVGLRKKYYGGKHDAILMTKIL